MNGENTCWENCKGALESTESIYVFLAQNKGCLKNLWEIHMEGFLAM